MTEFIQGYKYVIMHLFIAIVILWPLGLCFADKSFEKATKNDKESGISIPFKEKEERVCDHFRKQSFLFRAGKCQFEIGKCFFNIT